MGQRGNYVIKANNKTQIYYTHWRANDVASDLMIGTDKFIKFVQGFEQRSYLTSEPWIECCVHIDMDRKELLFWEVEDLTLTSVRRRYLKLLAVQWKDWKIFFAEKEMYAIEAKMNINYTVEQEYDYEYDVTIEDFINEEVDEYETCIIIYIKDGKTHIKCSYDYEIEEFIFLGEQILKELDKRKSLDISKRLEIDVYNVALIDCDQKKLIINYVHGGFKEKLVNYWKGWTIDTGNYGYIAILEKSGIDTTHLKMNPEEVDKQIQEILSKDTSFDSVSFAENIMKKDTTAKFHQSFFQNRKPSKDTD